VTSEGAEAPPRRSPPQSGARDALPVVGKEIAVRGQGFYQRTRALAPLDLEIADGGS